MPRRVRVLHVLRRLAIGGVERWLVDLAGAMDRGQYQIDFALQERDSGELARDVLALGCKVHLLSLDGSPVRYAVELGHVLRRGEYDIVHSHVHHFSGLVLLAARLCGVPWRIAHCHSDTRTLDAAASLQRRAYLAAMKTLVRMNATLRLAASESAAAALYGARWRSERNVRILHCGIDVAKFRGYVDREEVRRELGILPNDLVVGHVGRFAPPKNHDLIVAVAGELVRSRPDTRVVLIGDGPLRADIANRLKSDGLSDRVVLTGVRQDVHRLLRCFDVFLLPSKWEGMPLGLVEAQAAGLPCVVSDVVAPESFVVPENVTTLSLTSGARAWADAILAASRSRVDRNEALRIVEESSFSIKGSAANVEAAYRDQLSS